MAVQHPPAPALDVHQKLEADISNFLQTPSTIIYAQAFTCIASVIPSFAKRGDIIVADRLCNFAIQKGLQISRSQIRWYEHGDMSSLEQVLESVTHEAKRKGGKLTRRFIVTEGLFENDGMISDLEKLVELKHKYKCRLILDESFSFGTLGATGRGLTELSGVPVSRVSTAFIVINYPDHLLPQATEVDMLVGSMATGLNAGGGFCSGSKVVTEHQVSARTRFRILLSLNLISPPPSAHQLIRLRVLRRSPRYARYNGLDGHLHSSIDAFPLHHSPRPLTHPPNGLGRPQARPAHPRPLGRSLSSHPHPTRR